MDVSLKLVKIEANKDSFKTTRFQDGLNLVVAHRTESAAITDSRNGVGKSTLLQAIDYCLGGSVRSKDSLGKLQDSDWEFKLTIALGDKVELEITRGFKVSGVTLRGSLSELGFEADEAGKTHLGLRAWTEWLGSRVFGLSGTLERSEYAPTFRRLIGHFLRFRDDAYIEPFETFAKQRAFQREIDNSFLLGLDWRLGEAWQELRERSAKYGRAEMDEVAERLGELESRRASAEVQHAQLERQLRDFEVLPEYRNIEENANRLTAEMQRLGNAMLIDSELLSLYQTRLATEFDEDEGLDLKSLYEEAGVLFPGVVQKTLDDVRAFRAEVASNRKEYLASEIRRIEISHRELQSQLYLLEAARQQELLVLQSHRALDDFIEMQRRSGELAGSLKGMASKIEELREVRKGKSAIKSAELDLSARTQEDFDQRINGLATTIARFNEIFVSLYSEEADLVIDPSSNGYRFKVSVPRQGSHGLGKVSVFAYDLCISERWSHGKLRAGFLAHDSIVFDGVDERQTAGSIHLVAQSASELNYQYLLTINSDDIPLDELADFGIDTASATILNLYDDSESGGLLGIRL